MRISHAKSILEGTDLPVFLWGPPGIGKSAIVKQLAEEHGLEFIDLRLTLLDPTDLRGIPFLKDGSAEWAPPVFLPRSGAGVLFFDELNAAPPTIQASAYQLILDRKVGEYSLPTGWKIVAAGNRETDRAVTFRMPKPLSNRFLHIEIEPNLEDWKLWAMKNDIHSQIISFLNFRPGLLFVFEPTSASQAFATPRTWEYASSLLSSDLHGDLLRLAIVGVIGEGAAAELWSFLEMAKHLPSIDDILQGENTVPENPSILYAVVGSLVNRAAENLDRVLEYSLHLPEEFAVLLVKDIQRNNNIDLFSSPVWPLWVQQYKEIIL